MSCCRCPSLPSPQRARPAAAFGRRLARKGPSFPQAPILLPTRFVQEDGLPGTTPDSPHCRSPGKNGQDKHGSLTKRPAPKTKTRKALCPPRFCFIPDIRSKVRCARTARHTHQKQEEEGTMPSSSCFPGPRAVVRSPPSSGGDQRPHLKKVFWKGVRGRTFCPQKVSPASLPSSHIIAAQRRCCPCRSCRRAG